MRLLLQSVRLGLLHLSPVLPDGRLGLLDLADELPGRKLRDDLPLADRLAVADEQAIQNTAYGWAECGFLGRDGLQGPCGGRNPLQSAARDDSDLDGWGRRIFGVRLLVAAFAVSAPGGQDGEQQEEHRFCLKSYFDPSHHGAPRPPVPAPAAPGGVVIGAGITGTGLVGATGAAPWNAAVSPTAAAAAS